MPTTSRGPSGRSRPSGPRLSSRAARSSTTDAPSSASASTTSTAPPQAAVGGSTDSDDSPRSSLTTRSAVLLGVLAILAASYALPVRAWLDQRAQIAEVAAERTELASEVADLQAALDLWDDAAYVRAQARERLNFVLPGEVGLVVLGTESTPEQEPVTGAVVPAAEGDQPWWSTLLSAFTEVGNAEPAPPPEDGGPAADDAS